MSWAETTTEVVALGGALGLVGAALFHWIVWPRVLGWHDVAGAELGERRRRWTTGELLLFSAILGAWFGLVMGVAGLVLFTTAYVMWALNRSARLGSTEWK